MTTQTPEQIRNEVRATLTGRLAAVRSMGVVGFVQMTPYGAAYKAGSPSLTGLENATVTARPSLQVIQNRAGDVLQTYTVSEAKKIIIAAIQQALAAIEEMFPG
jgi:hypothetical protein